MGLGSASRYIVSRDSSSLYKIEGCGVVFLLLDGVREWDGSGMGSACWMAVLFPNELKRNI